MYVLRATTDVAHNIYYGSATLMYQGTDSRWLTCLYCYLYPGAYKSHTRNQCLERHPFLCYNDTYVKKRLLE